MYHTERETQFRSAFGEGEDHYNMQTNIDDGKSSVPLNSVRDEHLSPYERKNRKVFKDEHQEISENSPTDYQRNSKRKSRRDRFQQKNTVKGEGPKAKHNSEDEIDEIGFTPRREDNLGGQSGQKHAPN